MNRLVTLWRMPGKSPTSARQRQKLLRQQFSERFWISHWRFAGEIFTDVSSRFSIDLRHRADGFVFFAEIFLAFSSVGQKQNFIRQKTSIYLREQRFRRGIIGLSCDHNLTRFA